ncbi:hypothetical protein C1646_763927 [Rhizophagus diaphanus]|nr:hypothetical protein C1646_763927 [Rhizophagus diaphanus] [Rhizophagus sp. MUCL 43196]
MEQPSVTYSATQSVDYLGQTHKWTNTDVISYYKENMRKAPSYIITDFEQAVINSTRYEFPNHVLMSVSKTEQTYSREITDFSLK